MISDVITVSDSEKVLTDIGIALESLYKTEMPQDDNLFHPVVVSILEKSDKEDVQDRLRQLEENIRSRKLLYITMPSVPSHDLVEKIFLWMSNNAGMKVLLSIDLDPRIVGGCTLSYEGRYLDDSLKKRIEEYFDNKEIV